MVWSEQQSYTYLSLNLFFFHLQSSRQMQSGIYAQPKHITKVSSFRNPNQSKSQNILFKLHLLFCWFISVQNYRDFIIKKLQRNRFSMKYSNVNSVKNTEISTVTVWIMDHQEVEFTIFLNQIKLDSPRPQPGTRVITQLNTTRSSDLHQQVPQSTAQGCLKHC